MGELVAYIEGKFQATNSSMQEIQLYFLELNLDFTTGWWKLGLTMNGLPSPTHRPSGSGVLLALRYDV